jgi:hypothetical protein
MILSIKTKTFNNLVCIKVIQYPFPERDRPIKFLNHEN